MTDEELKQTAMVLAVGSCVAPSNRFAEIIYDAFCAVRLSTARACAEECEREAELHEAGAFHAQFDPERSDCTNRQVGAERCASAIRARFGVK